MKFTVVLAFLAVACALWAGIASVRIARYVQIRGIKVNYLLLRLMIFKYLSQYREISRNETGRVGPLFYHYVVPLLVALLLAIVIIVIVRT
jgi:hypothetical protein